MAASTSRNGPITGVGGPIITQDLTPEQNALLNSLWKTYSRELVDVRPSAEDKDASLFMLNTANAKLQPHAHHAYNFCLRLHAFFVSFLTQQQQQQDDDDSSSQSSSSSSFVNKHEQSCLRDYARMAFVVKTTQATSTSQQQQHPKRRLLLRLLSSSQASGSGGRCGGRSVLFIHHEEFLQEFNHFELQGQTPSADFIRRDSFGSFLYHMPDDALQALGCAMALALVTLHLQQQSQQHQQQQQSNSSSSSAFRSMVHAFCETTKICVRFLHVQPVVQMMDVKTGLVGKFVTIKGHVVKARPRRLRVATAEFVCQKCGAMITQAFCDGRYTVPTRCISSSDNNNNNNNNNNKNSQQDQQHSCKSRTFALGQTTMARYIDVQELRLQEAQEESTIHVGRTPRQLRVEATHDLVDACRPGDVVLVVATVAAMNTAAGKRGKISKETSTYSLYLKAHSITTMSESDNQRRNGGGQQHDNNSNSSSTQIAYTQPQLQKIVQLCHADHRYFGLMERRAFPFDLLVRSLCPSIIGHNEVKAGLVLCLLGGTPPSGSAAATGADRGISIRSNSHMLIVGDPGMGKSQMLLAANQLAARSVYVGGNTSSTTGLTVTLTKEDKGESGIEAGALVLADQGICCIDEFDKMASKHQDGLLEAMEQQQVSIAKAGVVASLPARCSVIAAANPKHGSYNLSRTVAENLNMSKPILSRFDLVFVLRDRADKDLDRLVSSNIMNLYRGGGDSNSTSTANAAQASMPQTQSAASASGSSNNSRMSLSSRLAWVADFQKQPLPLDLLRDYIAYAREYCKPKLTPEAATVLKDFFMELRYPSDGRRKSDTVPITTRQLEALIRLCQARAKACLRDFVLREDALDVMELMSRSMEQVHTDETGTVDPTRGGAGGTSKRKIKKAFINEVQTIVGVGNCCTLDDLRRIADKVKCGLNDFNTIVEDLRGNGILMKTSSGQYKVLS